MTAFTLTSLGTVEGFFCFSVLLRCSTRLPLQGKKKKSYYVSHIQVWTANDGQSSHRCRGASRASPTFSKKSVIHSAVNVFWCVFSVMFFWLIRRLCSLCQSLPLSRRTGARCSPRAAQFFQMSAEVLLSLLAQTDLFPFIYIYLRFINHGNSGHRLRLRGHIVTKFFLR